MRAVEKALVARELHRRPRAAVQHAQRVDRGVGGMHAGDRNPMVPRDLPGNRGKGVVCQGVCFHVILPRVRCKLADCVPPCW